MSKLLCLLLALCMLTCAAVSMAEENLKEIRIDHVTLDVPADWRQTNEGKGFLQFNSVKKEGYTVVIAVKQKDEASIQALVDEFHREPLNAAFIDAMCQRLDKYTALSVVGYMMPNDNMGYLGEPGETILVNDQPVWMSLSTSHTSVGTSVLATSGYVSGETVCVILVERRVGTSENIYAAKRESMLRTVDAIKTIHVGEINAEQPVQPESAE